MSAFHLRLVYILVAVNVLAHIGDLPIWIIGYAMVFIIWRWLHDVTSIYCPGRWGAAFFGVVGSVGIWFQFNKLIGDPASSALLVVMIALKTLEVRAYRDLMSVTYLCLLLLMAKLLNSQSLTMTLFLFADVTAILALMYLYHQPYSDRGLPWRRAVKLLGMASPVFILLFFLFPRFNFALFQRPSDDSKIGFSGHVRPGAVSRLAQSDKVAFRAFFVSGFRPPVSRLYWRGAVLEEGSGMNWDPAGYKWIPLGRAPTDDQVEIRIEEGGSPWLFTLDFPMGAVMSTPARQTELRESTGSTFSLSTPLRSQEYYAFSYDLDMPDNGRRDKEIATSKVVEPPKGKLKELIDSWVDAQGKPEQALNKIRTYFEEGDFRYTLAPPKVDSVEDFLFTSHRGFCEHYAAATTTLLRLMGIPARVVVGYQGGSPSLMGDYWIVYQRDAHAWLEYWEEARSRWVRLDPTAWVAADRVALGGQSYFEQNQSAGTLNAESGLLASLVGRKAMIWLMRSRLVFDQAEVMWTTFLVRYDFKYQQNLLASLGIKDVSRKLLFGALLGGLVVLGLLTAWLMRLLDFRRRDLAAQVYHEIRRRLANAGLEESAVQGPLTTCRQAVLKWPHLVHDLELLFGRVIEARYGQLPLSEDDAIELRKRLRRLPLNSAQHD